MQPPPWFARPPNWTRRPGWRARARRTRCNPRYAKRLCRQRPLHVSTQQLWLFPQQAISCAFSALEVHEPHGQAGCAGFVRCARMSREQERAVRLSWRALEWFCARDDVQGGR